MTEYTTVRISRESRADVEDIREDKRDENGIKPKVQDVVENAIENHHHKTVTGDYDVE